MRILRQYLLLSLLFATAACAVQPRTGAATTAAKVQP